MKTDIILCGVGGQGILSIATIIGEAAMKEDLYIKQAEVHGMSQRGGDVQSNLRISSEPIASDLIPMGSADVIIESAVALTQEIHDGPFETYTGHGIWASWNGYPTYSLKDKTLIRFDLDENLKKAWDLDKKSGDVQAAIDKGLPKTKMSKIPFRMEMSAFSRLEKSIPVVGDIGVLWSVMALKVSQALNIELDYISYPQQTEPGKAMREWIVDNIDYMKMDKIKQWLNS